MLRQAISNSSRAALRSAARQSTRSVQIHPGIAAAVAASRTAPAAARPVARWYSAEATEKKENGDAAAAPGEAAKPAEGESEVEKLKKQLEAKDAEARDWKDKYLRSVAEFRNLQDRTAREMKAARDFAIQKFAKDLVDSVDNFDRALTMVPEEKLKGDQKNEHIKDLVNLYEGLKMTENILIETLKKHGLERFDPHGLPFNPNEHEATFMTPMPDKENNSVFHTQQKGFKLNGRVLRPAKVGVVKNK
ncbi:GrpE-domain-containing protein [Podospora australis]|uniref:GrpE protein homolog n=1 Tax=Podospora australis TaxID=1536484 RepID=A0AAN6WZ39_9PEZI|nr:GrpE-domain-containing protein [Podospora australis]